jgi:hypothetical protein
MTSMNEQFVRNVDAVTMSKKCFSEMAVTKGSTCSVSALSLWHCLLETAFVLFVLLLLLFVACTCPISNHLSSLGNLKLLLMNLIQYHTHKSMIEQTSLTPQFLDEIMLNKWIQVSFVSVVNSARTGSRLKPAFQRARLIESLFLYLLNGYESIQFNQISCYLFGFESENITWTFSV